MKSYKVVYERGDDGWWAASVLGVRGCRTQGRSLAQARERIREALSLFVKDAQRAGLREQASSFRPSSGDGRQLHDPA